MTLDVSVVDAETGEAVPNGPVTVYADGNVVGTGEVHNGKVTVVTDIDEIGTYDITVVYEGNENYTTSNTTLDDVEVVGRESDITAEPANTTYGNTTVDVVLVDPVTDEPITNATIIITLPDGTNVTAKTDDNGSVEVPVDLPVGENNITVTYPGDETYNGTNTTITVKVTPRDSTTTADVVNNTVGNVVIDVKVVDTETGENVPDGPVEVYVNDTLVGTGEIVDGQASIPVDINEIGTYDIDVRYLGNEYYAQSNDLLEDVEIVGRDATIDAQLTNNTFGNTSVAVDLTDTETGKPISNAAVIITLPDGTNVTAVTDNNGHADVPVDLPVGDNDITVTYPGDGVYNAAQTTIPVSVIKRGSVTDATVVDKLEDHVVLEVNVYDAVTGKPVPNGPVSIKINDSVAATGEVVDGKAIITLNDIGPGFTNFTITYHGNENYTGSEKRLDDIKVVPKEAIIEPQQDDDIIGHTVVSATLRDVETGEVIANQPLIFMYNGTVVGNGTTDENGVVQIVVDLPAGDYVLDVLFTGNTKYSSTLQKLPITINKRSSDIKPDIINNIVEETEISVELTDPATGDLLVNKTVKIVLPNGTEIESHTDENGMLDLPIDLPAGLNNITVYFAGDGWYNASENSFTINVVKRNATLTPTVVNNTNGVADVVIKAVDTRTGKLITSGVIEVVLADGTKVSSPLTEEGTATFTEILVPVGTTDFNATLIENPVYNRADTSFPIDNQVRIIKIGVWKLVCFNKTPENNTITPKKPQVKPDVKNIHKYQAKHKKYAKYDKHHRYNKHSGWCQHPRRFVPVNVLSKLQYRLFITLYADFLEGDMDFSDFVAILKLNGIEIARVSNWDENGEIILDYNDLSEVPDTIELHDNSENVQDYVQNIDKNKQPSSSGEIDSGDIEVETTANANANGGSNSNNHANSNGHTGSNANGHTNVNGDNNANAEAAA